MMNRKRQLLTVLTALTMTMVHAQSWPAPTPEAKPGTRWWWLGSAVDRPGLTWNLDAYAKAGIGTVEITPLYGVKGNESHERSFLSPEWMEALRQVQDIAGRHHIEVDMNCGTGWPFGGPTVGINEAACKVVFADSIVKSEKRPSDYWQLPVPEKEKPYAQWQCTRVFPTGEKDTWRVISVYASRTRQKVKRAAPGGEGWVMDHFDRQAVRHYLERFTKAFEQTKTPYPHTFFNDSYEVYKANWTPRLFEEFQRRRGYDLRDHLPELIEGGDDNKTLADYRETLSDLLYENFTRQWTDWAHRHGVKVRNQAHGSPANLLDLYAAVDIPETEGFGLSDFGIKGLRTDSGMTRKNYSDVSMLKYASSAAHVMGKPLTSSETFTWLTEHFRTSLSQMKPDLDLLFTCGINHVFFHGSCYTPENDPWPGWKFYASVDMSPTNSIWRDAPYLMKYIERCQCFLQKGAPDNDFLVYLPIHDMWRQRESKTAGKRPQTWGDDLLMQFEINSMNRKAPQFIRSILRIDSLGYDCDYISDRQLAQVRMEGDRLVTQGGSRYRALLIPSGTRIDERLKKLLEPLTPYIIYGEDEKGMARYAQAEQLKRQWGVRAIRRKDNDGWHYFVANLTPNDVDGWTTLAVPFRQVTLYDAMTGDVRPAEVRGETVHLQLRSGESIIIQTSDSAAVQQQPSRIRRRRGVHQEKTLTKPWTLTWTDEVPRVAETYRLDSLQTWETLSDSAAVTMGTGVYTTTVRMTPAQCRLAWMIDLGDVRESARVYVNGQLMGCAWAVPFVLDLSQAPWKRGNNELRIEVTNLPANRIADMDRRGVEWRKFKEINIVDLHYKKTRYDHWMPMKSGLAGRVRLYTK